MSGQRGDEERTCRFGHVGEHQRSFCGRDAVDGMALR